MPHVSHSVTCHPAEVTFPPLPPAEAGTRLSDLGGMQGWVDLVVCVCLSVIFGTTRPIFTKCFVHVTMAVARSSSGGLVIGKLCSSGFIDYGLKLQLQRVNADGNFTAIGEMAAEIDIFIYSVWPPFVVFDIFGAYMEFCSIWWSCEICLNWFDPTVLITWKFV